MRMSSPNDSPFCLGRYNEKSEFCRRVCRHATACIQKTRGEEYENRRETFLQKLRDDFRKRDILALDRHLEEGRGFLTEEDIAKIRSALDNLAQNGTLLERALVILKGKVVDTHADDGVQ